MEKLIKLEESIGKRITNIYTLLEVDEYGNDKAECFIELDNTLIIDIPFGFTDEILVKDLNKDAQSLFADLADYPVYHINRAGKSIGEIAENYNKKKKSILNRLLKYLFGIDVLNKAYQVYKVEYKENKLKHIQNRMIADFIWFDDEIEKSLFLLDNGYLITETNIAFPGTGLAGLNFYENIETLIERKGNNFKKFSENRILF